MVEEAREYVSKLRADVIVTPPSIILNRPWQLPGVHEDWRKAYVTPIFKKDKREDPENYMPDNFNSIPAKDMEHLILETI